MEWASTIFPFETRIEPSEFIERIWRTRVVPERTMISVAIPRWHILVVQYSCRPPSVIVRGPETRASIVEIPQAEEFMGIEFRLGTFLPTLALETLIDAATELDGWSRTQVALAKSHWEIPSFDTAADFAARLARSGALVRDPVVEQVLLRKPVTLTERSVQRRFRRATGLTYGTVQQIERAERTVALLSAGTSILDAVEIAGYSDQAHLTRSLRRYVGKTPGVLLSRRP